MYVNLWVGYSNEDSEEYLLHAWQHRDKNHQQNISLGQVYLEYKKYSSTTKWYCSHYVVQHNIAETLYSFYDTAK